MLSYRRLKVKNPVYILAYKISNKRNKEALVLKSKEWASASLFLKK